jgi:hypothetical protein
MFVLPDPDLRQTLAHGTLTNQKSELGPGAIHELDPPVNVHTNSNDSAHRPTFLFASPNFFALPTPNYKGLAGLALKTHAGRDVCASRP